MNRTQLSDALHHAFREATTTLSFSPDDDLIWRHVAEDPGVQQAVSETFRHERETLVQQANVAYDEGYRQGYEDCRYAE